MGNANGEHVFRLEILFGNFGLLLKKSRFLRKFFVWENQNRLTLQPKCPYFFVNGKQQ